MVAAFVAALAAAPAPQVPGLTPNEQLIIDFFAFTGTREERAARFMTPDYIQHNPRFLRMDEITGAKGNEAWVKAGEEATRRRVQLVALPGIALRNPIIVMNEGDMAFAVYRGTRPDPANPAATYDVFAFESFRIRDGKFSEHWDQVRLAPGWMTPPAPAPAAAGRGGNAQGGGRGGQGAAIPAVIPEPAAGCTATPAQIAANKRLARSMVEGPSPAYVRTGRTLDHLVAECDYVSIVWKQVLPDPDTPARTWEAFTFDSFQIRDGRVVAHWDDTQR